MIAIAAVAVRRFVYHEATSMSMIMACMTALSLVNYPSFFERLRSISFNILFFQRSLFSPT